MAFTTSVFIFFFLPITVIGYQLINLLKKDTLNTIWLILFSLIFYAFNGLHNTGYLVIFSTIIFIMGTLIERYRSKNSFIMVLIALILLLSYYKYGNFVLLQWSKVSSGVTIKEIIIPMGLSFIIFESISYLIDIYRGDATAGNFLDVLLFFVFFPKVLSGPIVLWKDFQPQIHSRATSVSQFYDGIERIMIGFAKKTILADSFGVTVTHITHNALFDGIDSPTAILGMVLYFLQLYFDFAGYSDIAVGVSALFGFHFKKNFDRPYTSITLAEFWRRWHISLGTWFREYIYIPLGGNRSHVYRNLMIVFLVTGIWHGSTLNYVLWGVAHGLFIVLERASRKKKWYVQTPTWVKWLVVNLYVMFTWVIFMFPKISEIKTYYLSILGRPNGNLYFTYEYFLTNKLLVLLFIGLIFAFCGKTKRFDSLIEWTQTNQWGVVIRFLVLLVLFVIALMFMVNSAYSPFLYFQF